MPDGMNYGYSSKLVNHNYLNMRVVNFLFVGLLLTGSFTACSDDDDNNVTPDPGISASDRTFMQQAAYGNKAEVDAGQLASVSGNHAMVKMFGSMMVSDHTTAYDDLSKISDSLNIDIPEAPDSAHLAMKQHLQTLSGYAFDTTYIAAQVMDHQKTVALFQRAVDSSAHQGLKAYAAKYLPGIKMHLQKADSIKTALKSMGDRK